VNVGENDESALYYKNDATVTILKIS